MSASAVPPRDVNQNGAPSPSPPPEAAAAASAGTQLPQPEAAKAPLSPQSPPPPASATLSPAAAARLREWLHCICVVTFDLELGQAMELVYPAAARLSEAERTNICYLAFPDSNSGCMGDTQFHVRLRRKPDRPSEGRLGRRHRRYNGGCEPRLRADAGHFWGFVYFRQIRDQRRPRGYFQKSLVLLTRLPFVHLFHELCACIAPLYFDEACGDAAAPIASQPGCPGLAVLEAACAQIGAWPALVAGRPLQLHLLGTVWRTEIAPARSQATVAAAATGQSPASQPPQSGLNLQPSADNNNHSAELGGADAELMDRSTSSKSSDTITTPGDDLPPGQHNFGSPTRLANPQQQQQPPHRVCAVQDVDIYRSLGGMLSHVHLLWELVLTAEPIVVMAGSPTDCAHMVQSLLSLIAPLAFCAESRPYFTIHDTEFREFTQRAQGPPPLILGVTNPFFAKTLQRWPHTIRLGCGGGDSFGGGSSSSGSAIASAAISAVTQKLRKMKHSQQQQQQQQLGAGAMPSGNSNSSSGSGSSSATAATAAAPDSASNGDCGPPTNGSGGGGSGGGRSLDQPPGLYTAYRPFLQKDAGGAAGRALKQIQAGRKTQRPSAVQSALLRRHLLQLTQSFMIPLERYMASLMPLQRDIQPFRAPPPLGCFRPDEFLATLATGGPQLTSSLRGDWPGLYKRFFRSANFKGWYDRRTAELQHALAALQMEALAKADLTSWLQGRHEVEIVDMVLRLKQKLRQSAGGSDANGSSASPRRQQRRDASEAVSKAPAAAVDSDEEESCCCCSDGEDCWATSDEELAAADDDGEDDAAAGSSQQRATAPRRQCRRRGGGGGGGDGTDGGQRQLVAVAVRRRLRQHLQQVCARLPEDLRRIINGGSDAAEHSHPGKSY